ncbi:MAG: NUDIX hydrolase [Dehalococcoidales bacterium]|nr:NUDIX hydrolase [Dehalococcoidales bacterium]
MPEETISSKTIYKGQILNLRIDEVRLPDGTKGTREIIEHSDCIAVVPVDNNGNILLVRQYRKPLEKMLLEIPAGGIEPGENPDKAVRREMQEETGFLPGKVKRMGGFYASPGYCQEYLHLYTATDLLPTKLHAEDTDSIELVPVPLSKIEGLIKSGEIIDAKSVAGILYYLYIK